MYGGITMRIRRRITTVAVGTVAALSLGVGSASAHYCFFNDPNPNAQQGRAGSQGFFTFETITSQFLGLCPEGGQILADAGGVSMDTLINAHGLMAGPTGGNKAISHLDFGAVLPAGPEAFAACGMDLPDDWFE
jgi:hypothetical protein